MDDQGHLYWTPEAEKELGGEVESNDDPPKVVTPERLAELATKPGCSDLTQDELLALAKLPRAERRMRLSEMRLRAWMEKATR